MIFGRFDDRAEQPAARAAAAGAGQTELRVGGNGNPSSETNPRLDINPRNRHAEDDPGSHTLS